MTPAQTFATIALTALVTAICIEGLRALGKYLTRERPTSKPVLRIPQPPPAAPGVPRPIAYYRPGRSPLAQPRHDTTGTTRQIGARRAI